MRFFKFFKFCVYGGVNLASRALIGQLSGGVGRSLESTRKNRLTSLSSRVVLFFSTFFAFLAILGQNPNREILIRKYG